MSVSFADPEFVEMPERYVVALAKDFTMANRHEIPKLWGQLWQHDFDVDGLNRDEAFGVSYGQTEDGGFSYGAGYEVLSNDVKPKGGCIITLSAGRYARFAKRVPFAEIPAHFDWVFCDWLPASGCIIREGAVFEVYPEDPEATEEARMIQVWLPISKD